MSVQALGWVLDHSPTRGADRLVLMAIANHAGKVPNSGAFEGYPGVRTIQRQAGLQRTRTVQEAVDRLVAAGALERIIRGAPDARIRGDRRPNLYRILMSHGVACGDGDCSWCASRGVPSDGMSSGGVVSDDALPLGGTSSLPDGVPSDGMSSESRGAVPRHHGVPSHDITGCRPTAPEPSVEPSVEPVVVDREVGDTAPPSTEPPPPEQREQEPTVTEVVAAAVELIADRRVAAKVAKGEPVSGGYRPAVVGGVRREHGDRLAELFAEDPTRTPAQLVDLVDVAGRKPTKTDPLERTAAAAARLRDRNAAPPCESCGGPGWVEDDDGMARPCECITTLAVSS